ncbi:hypothetical protein QQP08_024856, partial [Theobroma cacao]
MEFEDDKLMSRVFGLGLLCTSLPTRLAQFSYCIGNVLDPNYIYNELGDSTSLKVIDGDYHALLEGISIGEDRLSINERGVHRSDP